MNDNEIDQETNEIQELQIELFYISLYELMKLMNGSATFAHTKLPCETIEKYANMEWDRRHE